MLMKINQTLETKLNEGWTIMHHTSIIFFLKKDSSFGTGVTSLNEYIFIN